jgi:hypothetical protein
MSKSTTRSLLSQKGKDNFIRHTSIVEMAGQKKRIIRPGVLYPGVWGWDSPIYSIGLAKIFGSERAVEELEVSALGQASNGMIPHILFFDSEMAEREYYPAPNVWEQKSKYNLPISGISQPPLMAFAMARIYDIAHKTGEEKKLDVLKLRLQKLFDVAFNYQKWWYSEREIDKSGLVVSVHPWETGRDNACEWLPIMNAIQGKECYKAMLFDSSIRRDIRTNHKGENTADYRPSNDDYKIFTYLLNKLKSNNYKIKNKDGSFDMKHPFLVADVTINSFLQASNRALIYLCDLYGSTEQKTQLEIWKRRTSQGLKTLWNEDQSAFQSLNLHTKTLTETSNASFLPVLAREVTKKQCHAMIAEIRRWKTDYRLEYYIASSDPKGVTFDPKCYWRGPVWTIINSMVALGFMRMGEQYGCPLMNEMSVEICEDTIKLITKDDRFHEYHNPITGEGQGAPDFGFTSVAYFMADAILNRSTF